MYIAERTWWGIGGSISIPIFVAGLTYALVLYFAKNSSIYILGFGVLNGLGVLYSCYCIVYLWFNLDYSDPISASILNNFSLFISVILLALIVTSRFNFFYKASMRKHYKKVRILTWSIFAIITIASIIASTFFMLYLMIDFVFKLVCEYLYLCKSSMLLRMHN